ncbi:PAS domain S-box protein [Planktothrix agardhii]|jgi:PAS domain S-box-containing protein|uniref:PAS domain S-box protein n=1 Tax=Planktothrix agardhii TaxID=1160 RepID=UPI001F48D88B|nr:PAS domain S-box protein [Planktothrix agardhii]MCF3576547.1 PAS domain S-box protein [Planktothrix agardhii 1812]MCF3582580.1 PAS domain S-box protein [Planktothrix agardhii 1811]
MTTSEICSDLPNEGYQVFQSPTWDARWQINQFLGVIHDLIMIIDCEQQQIHVLPTKASPNLSSESNPFSRVLQELKNCQESSEFPHLIQQVIETQIAQNIIYKCDQDRSDYQILVEIYPLSTTEVIAVIKDLSQCSTVKAVLQKVSEKTHSPTPTPTPVLQTTKESLKKQIEERKRIETQLQARKTELETLMDNAGDSIVRLDKKLRYVFVNRRTAVLIQITQEKFIGKTNWELGISDPVAQEWDQNCQQVLDTGQPQQFEFDLETSEGLRSFQTLIVPEIQQGGEVKTLLATTRDITQQKRTFAETQKQNQFLNLLTEITSKIRQSLEINLILKTTVEEVQKVLNVDRVIMLKLDSQRGGTVVQESVIPQWLSLLSHRIYTPELIPYLSDAAVPDRVLIFSNLSQENLDACYLELMEFFQVKASLIVPIWLEKKEIDSMITPPKNPESTNDSSNPKPKLWGFMMAHQCAEPRQWATLETNFLKQLADQVGIALKQAQLIAELKQAHQCLSCHFDNSPLVVIEWDQQLKIKRWSSQAERIFGWTSAEVLGQQWFTFQEVFATNILQVNQEMIQLIDGTNNHQIIEAQNRTKDGRVIDCEWYNSVVRDEGGNLVSLLSLAQNVSDRKQSEEELHRVNRALRTISDCNQVLVRATTETELLHDVCQILINIGGYHFAWVGYTQYTSDKQIIPIAKAGFEAGYLDNLTVTWDDSEWGQGPSGTAVRTGQTCVFQNFETNGDYAPWKQQAQERGYTSSIALPLIMATDSHNQHLQPKLNGEISSIPFGVLNLYSTQTNAFDPAEVKLLKELVDDIVYGIIALRIRASHAETEKKFRQLAENIDDVFWITNALGNQFIYVSPAYQQIWNRNVNALYQNFPAFINTIHPQDQNRVLRARQNPDGRGFDLEYRILRPDGSYRWIWDRGFPILNETGELERRGGIAKDITHRKETEQLLQKNNQELELRVTQRTTELETANERLQFELMQRHRTEFKLRKSEEQYRTLVKNFPDGAVFLVDLDFRYTIADGMGLVLKGLSRKILEGKTIWQVLPPALLEIVEPLYRSALAGEITISEVEYDGRIYYHQALPVRNEQEEIFAGMVVMQDITERKQAEAERDKLIAIIEATPDLICSAKPGGEVVYYNRSARQIFGLDPEEKISNRYIPQHHPQWAVEIIENQGLPAAIRDGSWIGETALTSYDGQEIPLSQLIIAHKNQEGQVYLLSTMARDITEQKRSQANLLEAERRWRSLLENVRLLVVGLDRNGKVEYVNPFLLEVMGYTQTEVLGKNWLSDFQENSAQRLSASDFAELLEYDFKPYSQQLIETKLGEEKIISWNHTLLKDLQGNAIGMMSIGEDITERYAIERMKDEFISVVSHELRTPLTSIHGGLNLLSTGLINPQSERGVHVMKIVAESAERLVRLVNDILELERLESGKIFLNKQVVNAADLLLQATEQMQVMANRSGINLEVSSKSLQFYADPDRVLQVLTNLLSNAIKFSESRGGNIKLSVETELPENLEEIPKILFKIQDQGRGIPSDKIERIFERFHQVDASDSRKKGGTGLGLAICRSIVEQHGGQIWVRSKVDQGSCFYFTLPMAISTEVDHDNKTNSDY